MPVAQRRRFRCSQCGYEETRTIGDKLPDREMLRPCPRCAGVMEMRLGDEGREGDGVLSRIFGEIGKLFKVGY